MIDLERLACLLAAYEFDEPHEPGVLASIGCKPNPVVHVVTPKELRDWLAEDHCGDCTGMPSPCIRCYADQVWHKANWIVEHWEPTA